MCKCKCIVYNLWVSCHVSLEACPTVTGTFVTYHSRRFALFFHRHKIIAQD